MEGIEDGRAVDDCPYCVFVEPGITPCPQCQNRMRYVSARLVDIDERDAAMSAWRRGERDPALLETLWSVGFRLPC